MSIETEAELRLLRAVRVIVRQALNAMADCRRARHFYG